MTKYLSIDYGMSHVGLATSEYTLATPLISLNNDESLLSKLAQLIHSEGVTQIICGIPEGSLAPKIISFAKKLEEVIGMPVTLHPETLSTHEAVTQLRSSGASRTKLKNDHVYAACLILEDYLELKNSVN